VADIVYLERCALCWLAVISEQEFYNGSRTTLAQELCSRRISDDGNSPTVAETYRSSTYSAQNSSLSADHNAHAKLTYMSSLSAPDVHQVTDAVLRNFFYINMIITRISCMNDILMYLVAICTVMILSLTASQITDLAASSCNSMATPFPCLSARSKILLHTGPSVFA